MNVGPTFAVPPTGCGELVLVVNWMVPLATAAGFEKGSCTASVEYVTLTVSVKP